MWDWCQTIREIFCDSFSHPRRRQRLCGQGVQRIEGHERVEVGANNYSAFSAELSEGFVSESSNPDPGAIHTDAFTINWAPLRGYAPPLPFNLILMSKTLTKVTIDQTGLILVAPVWQAQPCCPVPLRLLISQLLLLPIGPTLFTDPTDLNRVHPMYPRLHLAVFHISTNVFHAKGIPTNVANLFIATTRISKHKNLRV